ncbi:MAG: hypothetical protein HZC11_06180 [Nitrospirae bacterium]|nr:hypothetical protein [Nitrospirota bacterium]
MSEYLKEALWIADLTVNKLADKNLLLPRRIDAQSGEIIDPERMIDDLGDYVQNIWYLGKILGNQGLMDFAVTSVCNAARFYQDDSGLFKSAFQKNSLIDWYSNEDVFVGLTSLYKLSKDRQLEEIILRFQRGLAKYSNRSGFLFAGRRGLLKYVSVPPKAFIEGLVHVYAANGSRETLELAKRLSEPWLRLAFFKRHGVFPSRMLNIDWLYNMNDSMHRYKLWHLRFLGECGIPKTNTNFLQGILELWNVTEAKIYEDSMRRWIDTAERDLIKNDLYAASYNVYSKDWSFHNKAIIPIIAVLAFYADFCKSLGDERVLLILEQRVKKILQLQTETGFFRDAPHDPKDPKYNRGFLDCQTDMSVLLLKLYCLTKNKLYLESAGRCIDSVIRYLKRPSGYIEYFNVSNGSAEYHSRMYVKFFTLFMKALILLDAVLSGKDVYQDELLIIAADR